ncbi:actin-10-related [Anaeramoeba flamelloides]|uniref:Actin-10-related n=1 Tax=Anaeramoeba flamelloides TaxID=1746091 RepID=A0AAV7YI77_9EUKA|nr:actin-10-related [Anaeramoeba flamelloides]
MIDINSTLEPIVIDNGSITMKVGLGGEDSPCSTFPTVVGKEQTKEINQKEIKLKETFVGKLALKRSGILSTQSPIKNGIIENWEAMEEIWNYICFDLFGEPINEVKVLLTESIFNPKENREKTAEIWFETFNTQIFYLVPSNILQVYSFGNSSGTSINSGANTSMCFINEGRIIKGSCDQLDIGGDDLTQFLQELLVLKGLEFKTYKDLKTLEYLKKCLSFYVVDDPNKLLQEKEKANKIVRSYELKDGQRISLGMERFVCTELFFQPKEEIIDLFGLKLSENEKENEKELENEKEQEKEKEKEKEKENENEKEKEKEKENEKEKEEETVFKRKTKKEMLNLPRMIYKNAQNIDFELRKTLLSNIILSGGNTNFGGIEKRLSNELKLLINENCPQFRFPSSTFPSKYMAWVGGSIFASLGHYVNSWMYKELYEESGVQCVHTLLNHFI